MENSNDFNTDSILVLASVFKGMFSIDWIQEITGSRASEILSSLNRGVEKNWLVNNSEGWYQFVDDLIRYRFWGHHADAKQKQLHQQAAQILSRDLPLMESSQEELTYHLLRINNDEEGCRQLLMAGNKARKAFLMDEAKKIYQKILQDLVDRKGDVANRLFADTVIQYSKIAPPALGSDNMPNLIKEAIQRAERSHLVASAALLRMHLAKQEWLQFRFKEAFRYYNQGWEQAQQIDDPEFRHSVTIFGVFFRYWQGRFGDVVKDYEQSAPAISELPHTEFSLLAHLTIGACLGNIGRIHQCIGMMDTIRSHCEKIGNLNIESQSIAVMAHLLRDLKRYDESIRYFKEALNLAIKGQNTFIQVLVHLGLASVYHRAGKKAETQKELKDHLALSKKHRILAVPFPVLMEICFDWESEGKKVLEGITLNEEIGRFINSENVYMKGMAVYFQARQKKQRGASQAEILPILQKALILLESSGHLINQETCRLDIARILIASGQNEEGHEMAALSVRRLYALDPSLVPADFQHLIQRHDAEKELLKEILSLGQELSEIRDPRNLVNRIISIVNRLIGAERGAIFQVKDQEGTVHLKAARNISTHDVESPQFTESLKLIRKTIKTKKEQIKHLNSGQKGNTNENRILSIVCIPLVIRNCVTGVLYSDFRINSVIIRPSDLEALKFFAIQAAILLDNAKSYRTLQDLYKKEREERRYLEEQFQQEFHFEEIIGQSQAIKTVFASIDSVAATDSAVLILGETGVGKELVARAIHRNSNRASGPFIKVNSSALSDYLVSSELFGHEKGAFTGAIEQKIGKFELANAGTLFLDEIGDISHAVQLQLLRVLQTREFERVGGHQVLISDFRLMAATNKDLMQEIKAGRFRLDLYYRLNVFPIEVPPLKKRKEDIPLLAHHFLKLNSKKLNKQIKSIPTKVLDQMIQYHWPGNVRELENFMERGTIISRNNRFVAPPIDLQQQASPIAELPISHQENERLHIIRTLEVTNGKISGKNGAAFLLNLHPNTLRYRMKKLNIQIDKKPTTSTLSGP